MRIEKIEINGFKSFRDKTIIDFKETGITGIVGPNGCGKSNIVDALLWVMGETAPKHLRSSSMSDVIFSGTKKEDPSPSAQVSLFLKQGDNGVFPEKYKGFSEIMITRRVTRQGESEYSINKQSCLLRDIQEIFMNTGAGCRGFSIIEQEAIEKLITSKPHERRFIIEEVAGITKFKTRKTESIRKLDRVNQNLQRVDDVIRTQEKQLNQLSRQAKKAEQYRKIKEEIRKKEWELFKRFIEEMEQRQGELKSEESIKNSKREEIKSHKEEGQDRLKILQQEMQEKGNSLDKDQSYLSELNCKIVEHTKDIEKFKLAIQIYNDNLETDLESHQNSLQEIKKNEERLEELDKESQKLKSKKEILTEDLNKAQKSFKQSQNGSDLIYKKEELTSKLQQNKDEQTQIIVNKKVMEAGVLKTQDEKTKLKDEIDSIENQIRKTIQEKNHISTALQKAQNRNQNVSKDISQITKLVENLKTRKSNLQREQEKLYQEVAQKTYKLQGMKNLVNKLEGFNSGTQALLNWDSKKFKPLFKEIKVESGFEKAVESALGECIKALIPEDKTSINDGIRYLKENQKGKTGFLSFLPTQQASPVKKEELKKYPAFIGLLSDKIKLSLEAESLRAIASQTAIVSNLSSAFELKSQFPSLQFVTKEGELITKDAFVYGGTYKDEIPLLKIQNQIKDVSEELKTKERLLEVKKDEGQEAFDRLTKSDIDLEKAKSDNSQIEVLSTSSQKELEYLEKELLRLTEQKTHFHKRNHDIEKSLQQNKVELGIFSKREKELNQIIQVLESELTQIEQIYKIYRDLKSKTSELEIKISANSKEKETLAQNKSILKESIEGLRHKNRDILKVHDEIKDKIQTKENRIKNIQRELDLYLEEKTQIEKSISEQQKEFQTKKENVEKQIKSLTQIFEEQTLFEKQQNEFRSEYESLDLQKQNLKDKLFENYQINIDKDILIPEYEEMPSDELKKSTQKLLEQLSKVSEVNLIALKEYADLEKEFTFLKNQREDLFNSQKELKKVINHIDNLCEKRFKEMLIDINLRFSRVFPIIFEGDDAEARLVPVENVDKGEEGIDILVRPPGKRTQNVSLLSRGEKALTSLCLIYSLFLVKPSPFCVLDEIDAPLDDANIFRFISILKEMVRKSQLIVITHNKYTMKACSQLYGVTMAQKGISQMVSVDLKDIDSPQPRA